MGKIYIEKAGILTWRHINTLSRWIFTRIMLINWAHGNLSNIYATVLLFMEEDQQIQISGWAQKSPQVGSMLENFENVLGPELNELLYRRRKRWINYGIQWKWADKNLCSGPPQAWQVRVLKSCLKYIFISAMDG